MTNALTAEQIAEILRVDRSTVVRRAAREHWIAYTVPTRGGKRKLFAVMPLPGDVREAVLQHLVTAEKPALPVPANQSHALAAPPKGLTPAGVPVSDRQYQRADWERRQQEARAALMLEIDRLAKAGGVNTAIRTLVQHAKAGTLRPDLAALVPLANARGGKAGTRTLSIPTLKRWRGEWKAGGVEAVAPKPAGRGTWTAAAERLWPVTQSVAGCHAAVVAEMREIGAEPPTVDQVERFISTEIRPWAEPLMKLYRVGSQRSIAACYEDLPELLPEGWPVPSLTQCRRHIARLDILSRNKGRKGPTALLAVKGHKRRSTEAFDPLAIVTADGHTFRAKVRHPIATTKLFQPEVVSVMDAKTRFVFGWSVNLAESEVAPENWTGR